MKKHGTSLSREATARILREMYPHHIVYIGGCHIAVHSVEVDWRKATWGPRIMLVTADGPDWT